MWAGQEGGLQGTSFFKAQYGKGPPRPVPRPKPGILVLIWSLRDSQVLCCPQPAGGRRALPRSWNWKLLLRAKPNKKKARPSWAVGSGLQIPRAPRESEAAAAQLCSLSCMSGGPRDLKQAHSFCAPLGPPQREAVVKCGNWQLKHQAGCFVDRMRKARPIVGYLCRTAGS